VFAVRGRDQVRGPERDGSRGQHITRIAGLGPHRCFGLRVLGPVHLLASLPSSLAGIHARRSFQSGIRTVWSYFTQDLVKFELAGKTGFETVGKRCANVGLTQRFRPKRFLGADTLRGVRLVLSERKQSESSIAKLAKNAGCAPPQPAQKPA